ncbi:MAG: IS200/IS605 family accessory protein TnpB-related protein [Dethiobacter sp.]|nr:IS200/IS605 family accessory protein TnpB-related protein [Dethiobacter sp.]
MSEQTANDIVDYAVQNKVDVIVFEYLNLKGKVYGSKKQKLHLWKKRFVYQLCLRKAHFAGIRVSPVNPANTSKLAFDGTGKVKRDEKNYSLCTFQSGKQYSTDLNASYNIGARYFIRELKKAVSEKKWSDCLAKVPDLQQRTQCTLSTLISFHVALAV